jgi:hypothetical protein
MLLMELSAHKKSTLKRFLVVGDLIPTTFGRAVASVVASLKIGIVVPGGTVSKRLRFLTESILQSKISAALCPLARPKASASLCFLSRQ